MLNIERMSRISQFKAFYSQLLRSPTKVANALERKKCVGSVLNLDICKDTINLAVASHPQYQEPIRTLQPISLSGCTIDNRRVLDQEVSKELDIVIRDFNVCGIVVGWPVEKEGWCGSPCGRVLHTLDQLSIVSETHGLLFSTAPEFPICLYDMNHYEHGEDEWGRSTTYCSITNEIYIVSSEKQSRERNSYNVADIWNDFSNNFWPDLSTSKAIARTRMLQTSTFKEENSFHDWFDVHREEKGLARV
jgi:hypothetical protein